MGTQLIAERIVGVETVEEFHWRDELEDKIKDLCRALTRHRITSDFFLGEVESGHPMRGNGAFILGYDAAELEDNAEVLPNFFNTRKILASRPVSPPPQTVIARL